MLMIIDIVVSLNPWQFSPQERVFQPMCVMKKQNLLHNVFTLNVSQHWIDFVALHCLTHNLRKVFTTT